MYSPEALSSRPGENPTATRAGMPAHPQQQGHRPGEVLAVAARILEQERVERVGMHLGPLGVRRAALDPGAHALHVVRRRRRARP